MPKLISLKALAAAIGALSALVIALSLTGSATKVPVYAAFSGLLLAGGILLGVQLGSFMRFFVVFYGIGYLAILSLLLVEPMLPASMGMLVPPPLTAFTAAAFGLLAILLARIPVTAQVFRIADPYFETADRREIRIWPFGTVTAPEKWIAMVLLGIIILINLGQVGISVRLSFWGRDWLDAIQKKDAAEFWRQLYQIWIPLVGVLIFSNLIEFILVSMFKIRWRDWSTGRLVGRWLDGSTHYRLQFAGNGVDNPDQRIHEDVNKYINTTYSLTISMISQISTLVSFAVILWGLSEALTLPGTDTKVPGLLFWVALAYAVIGTVVAHLIGRKLIPLNFAQEQYEANFRFSLARLREYAEPVALLSGERAEKASLAGKFRHVINNFFAIVGVQKWLSAFTQLYGSSNSVIPYVVAAPFYFAGQITLGVLNQTAGAFARVDAALSFFIDRYATLADFKAVVDRLTSFDRAIDVAKARKAESQIAVSGYSGRDLAIPSLALGLPDGRALAGVENLTFKKGERVLLVGPSGSGKSTLFRAVAGLWTFGQGQISVPSGASIMLLPQRPYIPIGSLRAAIAYPAAPDAFGDDALRAALKAVQLPQLPQRLDEEANWAQTLSGGEQQRLAVARALLSKPDWLFLDEATAALDEPLEEAVYAAIRQALPNTTVVSIGHRSSLVGYHDRRIKMEPGADGRFLLKNL